jgi:hypothetical protein
MFGMCWGNCGDVLWRFLGLHFAGPARKNIYKYTEKHMTPINNYIAHITTTTKRHTTHAHLQHIHKTYKTIHSM